MPTEMPVYYSRIDLTDRNNMEYLIALYDECILGVDQLLIKLIISHLKELGIYNNTLIIITADHGESLGEHSILGHGPHFYNEMIHIPLIIRVPLFQRGKKINGFAQSIDIMPTILELLGMEIPFFAQGKSMVPFMQKKNYSVHEYVYGQTWQQVFIRSLESKLIVDRSGIDQETCERDKLFNIRNDPNELHDLQATERKVYTRIKKNIKKYLEMLPVHSEKTSTFPPYFDKKTQDRIKDTGYW
jgi:arylsulfatase A-like enzyme